MNNLDNLIKEFIKNIESKDQQKCIDILNKLSECEGFNANTPINSNGKTLLTKAVFYSCLDVFKYLIEVLCADPNILDNSQMASLHWASYHGDSEIIDYLISVYGIDINIQDFWGRTALHIAAFWGSKESVKSLLRSNELDTSLRNFNGLTAEEVARGKGYNEIADMIACYEPSISVLHNK